VHRPTRRFIFTEDYWSTAGQRVFDILVNDKVVMTGIDPFALSGGLKYAPPCC
jgi:hypothetical protein